MQSDSLNGLLSPPPGRSRMCPLGSIRHNLKKVTHIFANKQRDFTLNGGMKLLVMNDEMTSARILTTERDTSKRSLNIHAIPKQNVGTINRFSVTHFIQKGASCHAVDLVPTTTAKLE